VVKKKKITTPIDDIRSEFVLQAREIINRAKEDGTMAEIEKSLQDPEIQKAYNKYLEEKLVDNRSVISSLMSIMYDIEVGYNSIDNYNFPQNLQDYRILRRAGRSIPANLIKSYRYNQLCEFGRISDGKNPGFNITYLDRQKNLSRSEKKICGDCENMIAKEFFFVPNDEMASLSSFLWYCYNDIFDVGKVAVEVIRERASLNTKYNNRGKPTALVAVDAGLIYPIVPKLEQQEELAYNVQFNLYQPQRNKEMLRYGYRPYYSDEYRFGMIDRAFRLIAVYAPQRMIYKQFFGTTDIEHQFKGYSVVERALDVMKYIMDSMNYNVTRRSANSMPKGMIVVEGGTDEGFSREEMNLFRKLIWGVSSGQNDKWKYPVVGTPKGTKTEFVKFHESSREMEDFLWLSTLFSFMCTFEGMSPEVINLASNKNTVGKQKLFDKREEEGAMIRSQDPGLRRYLNEMADTLNASGIFEELTGIDGVGLVWSGLDVEDEKKKLDIDKERLATTCSVNDLLVEIDKPKQKLDLGGVNIFDLPGIGNPQILQLISNALLQQSQQAIMAGNGEMPGQGGGGPGDEGSDKDSEYDEFPDWEETEEGEEESPAIAKKTMKKSLNGKDVTLTVEIQK
jgi:hypothetical protein